MKRLLQKAKQGITPHRLPDVIPPARRIPKSKLLEIPAELLLLIATFLTTERDLNALAQTNHHLYSMFNNTLYQTHIQHHGGIALVSAAENGQAECMQALLAHGADITAFNSEENPPWLLATKNGHASVLQVLLNHNLFNAQYTDAKEWSALFIAVKHGRVDVVRLLLPLPEANVGETQQYEGTLLEAATRARHWGVVRVLLASDRFDPSGWYICDAARSGSIETVKTFLDKGVDPNTLGRWGGYTPLICAAWGGHTDLVLYLLGLEGVDADQLDNDGNSAFHRAMINRHGETAGVLLARTSVSRDAVRGQRGHLITAAFYGYTDLVARMLQRCPGNLNHKGLNLETPLWNAVKGGSIGVVELLLNQPGIEPDIPDYALRTPLIVAAYYGRTELVKRLLTVDGVDINARSRKGETALLTAIEGRRDEVVTALLQDERTQLDCADEYGRTPQQWAKWNENVELEKLLVKGAAERGCRLSLSVLERAALLEKEMQSHPPLSG